MMYRPPTDQTRTVMRTLGDVRAVRGLSWRAVASLIEDRYGYRISEDQYRAAEQGITRNVPLDVLLYASGVLDVDPADIIATALQNLATTTDGDAP